jgi:hypothetical protein
VNVSNSVVVMADRERRTKAAIYDGTTSWMPPGLGATMQIDADNQSAQQNNSTLTIVRV